MSQSTFTETSGPVTSPINALPVTSPITALQQSVKEASIERAQSPTDMVWGQLDQMDWRKNKPWMVARILTEYPWNLTPPMALAVTLTAMEEGANPFANDIYVIDGKIVFSVQFKLKKARNLGMALGVPKYEFVERDWPANAQIYRTKDDKKLKRGTTLARDRGCQCTLPIGDDSIVQTAWLSTSHRPSTPWNEDPDHMLKVRAIDYCLRFTGIGISEPLAGEEDNAKDTEKMGKVVVAK